MQNLVIIVMIAVIVAGGIRSTVRHFKGQGGCCGGGGYRPKKKKLKKVVSRKTFAVEGMHCEHCKNRVEEIVNDIRGVSGKVNLKEGKLTVFYGENADAAGDELIKERMEKAGYRVMEIECRDK